MQYPFNVILHYHNWFSEIYDKRNVDLFQVFGILKSQQICFASEILYYLRKIIKNSTVLKNDNIIFAQKQFQKFQEHTYIIRKLRRHNESDIFFNKP